MNALFTLSLKESQSVVRLERPQTSFPSPHTHSSRLGLKLGLCFWYSDEEGVRGRQRGERAWVWGLEPDEMTKMLLERAWSIFASLPVLTFKLLSRGLDQPIRHMDSDLVRYQCALHYTQPTAFLTVRKARPLGI